MDDDKYYEQVAEELRENRIQDGLWTKCIAKSQGDDNKTKALYIQMRVEQLMREEARQRAGSGEDDAEEAGDAGPEPGLVEGLAQNLPPQAREAIKWIIVALLCALIYWAFKELLAPKLRTYL